MSASSSTTEFIPVAIAILSLCDGDVNRSIVEAASFGRDSDAIATVAGSLTGAIEGAEEIRPDWIEHCEQANTDLFEELEGDPGANFRGMADGLVTALQNERRRAREREEFLALLLDERGE